MAFSDHKVFAVTILLALMTMASAIASNSNTAKLSARLKVDGESANCWDSLFELHACSGEVITFFLNGETYLGPSCCQAIRVVGHDCWPNILASLGFSSEEDDILQDYCDHIQQHSPPSPTIVDYTATKVLP